MKIDQSRIAAAIGLLSLAAAIGLVSTHKSPATTAPAPVPVTDTNFSGAQAYSVQASFDVANGADFGSTTLFVPADKRLIIETVSMFRDGANLTSQSTQDFIGTTSGGTDAYYALPVAAPSNLAYEGTTQAMRIYADPHSEIIINGYRSGLLGTETDTINISGYLVNAS